MVLAPAAALCLVSLPACTTDDASVGDSSDTETSTTDSPETEGEDESETGEPDDPNLIEIPGGSFMMGCDQAHGPCDADNPAHEVTLSGYWIEATEVTVAAYTACVDAGACTKPDDAGSCNYGLIANANHPINCVLWQQAADYCAWMGRRLPSEAEWEFAATGGNVRPYPWGTAAANCAFAHMFETDGEMGDYGCKTGKTAAVGSYPNGASPLGMLDMAGNVDEWVADWYGAGYYATSPSQDPTGPSEGTLRVNRGGDMYDASSLNLRAFKRWKTDPNTTGPERGFRCAADSP